MALTALPYRKAKNKRQIKKLYRSAFPKEERAPWRRFLHGSFRSEIEVYYDEGEFVGFTVSLPTDTFYYVFYLAVADGARSKGYGGAILERVCAGRSLVVLDMEKVDESAPNYEQRLKRRAFYERNGFSITPVEYTVFGVRYSVMCKGEGFDEAEYRAFFRRRFARFLN